MGASESDSAPPAMTASAWPSAICSAASVAAWIEVAQAREVVWAASVRGQLGPEHHLAADEGGERRRDHLAEDEAVELLRGDAAAADELVHHDGAEVHRREVLEVPAGPDERRSEPGDHRDPAGSVGARAVRGVMISVGHGGPPLILESVRAQSLTSRLDAQRQASSRHPRGPCTRKRLGAPALRVPLARFG